MPDFGNHRLFIYWLRFWNNLLEVEVDRLGAFYYVTLQHSFSLVACRIGPSPIMGISIIVGSTKGIISSLNFMEHGKVCFDTSSNSSGSLTSAAALWSVLVDISVACSLTSHLFLFSIVCLVFIHLQYGASLLFFQRVSGGIILAPEGINGSICGTHESVERVLGFIQTDERLNGLRQIESPVSPEDEALHHGHSSSSPLAAGEDAPFRWDHVRVKLKREVRGVFILN